MSYQLTTDPNIIKRSDGAIIPLSEPSLLDVQEYNDWLNAGNAPEPYVPPVPIPDWDKFRRSLMTSTAWTVAIAPVNETRWQLAAIITATKGDVDPQVVAQLWNALDLGGLRASHITQLRGAVTSNHIPLAVADDGTITPT